MRWTVRPQTTWQIVWVRMGGVSSLEKKNYDRNDLIMKRLLANTMCLITT